MSYTHTLTGIAVDARTVFPDCQATLVDPSYREAYARAGVEDLSVDTAGPELLDAEVLDGCPSATRAWVPPPGA